MNEGAKLMLTKFDLNNIMVQGSVAWFFNNSNYGRYASNLVFLFLQYDMDDTALTFIPLCNNFVKAEFLPFL